MAFLYPHLAMVMQDEKFVLNKVILQSEKKRKLPAVALQEI